MILKLNKESWCYAIFKFLYVFIILQNTGYLTFWHSASTMTVFHSDCLSMVSQVLTDQSKKHLNYSQRHTFDITCSYQIVSCVIFLIQKVDKVTNILRIKWWFTYDNHIVTIWFSYVRIYFKTYVYHMIIRK